MAAGGSSLDGFSREHRDLVEGIFEENISVENLMHTSLSDDNTLNKSVTFTDLNDDVYSDVFTENGSSCQDSDSMASDKFNSDDNNSITNESESSDAKSKVKSVDNSFKKMSLNMSSVARKIRAPIEKLRNSKKNTTQPKPKKSSTTNLSSVKINKLPQLFTAKYLGKRKCSQLVGARVTKKHVDNMMKTILKNLDPSGNIELPLKYIVISTKGLHFREHPQNQVKGVENLTDCSIDSISYCVQDIKYWRVFTYILVKELSSRNYVAECHAFLCDSPVSARKMVVSIAAAFKLQVDKLKKEGQETQQFCVELRTPSELKTSLGDDCDV